jgi:hypothetical protein
MKLLSQFPQNQPASFIARLQRSTVLLGTPPGALPQAITFRAFGAFKPIESQVCYCAFKAGSLRQPIEVSVAQRQNEQTVEVIKHSLLRR